MQTPLRVGSVGLGGISKGVHLPGIHRSADLKQVALCDINPEALAFAADKYGIDEAHCFADYHDLVACPDVDVVDISTPNDVHFEVAMAAVAAGKSYCLEKPVTLNAEQARILAEATKKAGVKSMVCFSYRFKPCARYARELVRGGLLGDIYAVSMQYLQAGGLPDKDRALVWRYDKARTGTGALGDLGSHGLDLIRFVTGLDCDKIVAQADTYVKQRRLLNGEGYGPVTVDDFCNMMVRLQNGASAQLQITRFAYARGNYQRLEIYGSKGALVYSLDADPSGSDTLDVCIGEPARETRTFSRVQPPQRFVVDQMQSFADILLGKGDGLTGTIEDGLINQTVCDAAEKSFTTGEWVKL